MLSSASDKAKFFAKIFSVNSNLYDSCISTTFLFDTTTVKLHNIPAVSKLVKKVITNIDSSKSCPEFIPVVVL